MGLEKWPELLTRARLFLELKEGLDFSFLSWISSSLIFRLNYKYSYYKISRQL